MKKIITSLAGVALALGLAGCGASETTEPVSSSSETTSTSSEESATITSSEVTTTSNEATSPAEAALTTSNEATAQSAVEEPVVEEAYTEPSTVIEESYVAPQVPPPLTAEQYDPYGPPKFVDCWESNAALMSDGSIVTDTVNCSPEPVPSEVGPYGGPPRADGCVGPAAVCGYYDESGNPIWFDKMTGETSPRYYDEYGNPTMESY